MEISSKGDYDRWSASRGENVRVVFFVGTKECALCVRLWSDIKSDVRRIPCPIVNLTWEVASSIFGSFGISSVVQSYAMPILIVSCRRSQATHWTNDVRTIDDVVEYVNSVPCTVSTTPVVQSLGELPFMPGATSIVVADTKGRPSKSAGGCGCGGV
jgi:hypothetical protein